MRVHLVIVVPAIITCGGAIVGNDDASGDAAVADTRTETDTDGSSCSASSGETLCGGSCGTCHTGACNLQQPVPTFDAGDPSVLRICHANNIRRSCGYADDGFLCAFEDSVSTLVTPLSATMQQMDIVDTDIGSLYHQSGRDDLVRYADRAAFDGTALPSSTCPTIPGLPLCGGDCGQCPTPVYPTTMYACVGRSPVHPYSICANRNGANSFACQRDPTHPGACSGTLSCFTFMVDNASQAIADATSFMIDSAACAAAEQSYPGGAYCTCPP
jgi:hypothetical protein